MVGAGTADQQAEALLCTARKHGVFYAESAHQAFQVFRQRAYRLISGDRPACCSIFAQAAESDAGNDGTVATLGGVQQASFSVGKQAGSVGQVGQAVETAQTLGFALQAAGDFVALRRASQLRG